MSERCRKPMWDGLGMPAGHCGELAFGPDPEVGINPACPRHGGPTAIETRERGLYVVFSCPPGPISEFVEVEDENGHGFSIPWRQEAKDRWVLGPFAPQLSWRAAAPHQTP